MVRVRRFIYYVETRTPCANVPQIKLHHFEFWIEVVIWINQYNQDVLE